MKKLYGNKKAEIDIANAGKILGVVLVLAIFCACLFLAVVPMGHVGVYEQFGVIDHEEFAPGIYPKSPFAKIVDINVQTQEYEYKDITGTLTQEGLQVEFDASILYRIVGNQASEIRSTVIGDPFDTVITPAFMGIARDEIKNWLAEDIYTGMSTQIQDDIYIRLKEELASRGIIIEAVYLRGLGLPELVEQAIENKMKEKQAVEEMSFTVQKEELLAEQSIIKATATAEVNGIIDNSITPNLIIWKRLDIYKALAEVETNTFVIDGGSGSGNSPMILPLGKN